MYGVHYIVVAVVGTAAVSIMQEEQGLTRASLDTRWLS